MHTHINKLTLGVTEEYPWKHIYSFAEINVSLQYTDNVLIIYTDIYMYIYLHISALKKLLMEYLNFCAVDNGADNKSNKQQVHKEFRNNSSIEIFE